MIERIYLDLDGVLADFVTPTCQVHGKDPVEILKTWPRGIWDMPKALGLENDDALWAPLDAFTLYGRTWTHAPGADHWARFEPYKWAGYLWNLCEDRAKTTILTSPSRHPGSAFGKVHWMRAWRGDTFRNYALVPRKAQFGKPGSLLIDDNAEACAGWKNNGGSSILFPQVWNANHAIADEGRAFEFVVAELLKMEFKPKKSE